MALTAALFYFALGALWLIIYERGLPLQWNTTRWNYPLESCSRDRYSAVDWLQPATATPPPSPKLQAPPARLCVINPFVSRVMSLDPHPQFSRSPRRPHAPGLCLVLRLLSRAARPHTAPLPPNWSLREPGCLGDAAGRFLPQPALKPHCTVWQSASSPNHSLVDFTVALCLPTSPSHLRPS
jgi:hypothetical protein